MRAQPNSLRSRRAERGTIIIVAMLVSAIIAISIGSYIALSTNSLKLANRSFYNTAAINLAETGLEEALWAFNEQTAGMSAANAWQNWDLSDSVSAKRSFTDFGLSSNAQVNVKVYVDHYSPPAGSQPKVVAQATVTLPNDSRTLSKWVELTLRRRSKFAMGLVAKNQITFRGNRAAVDSWNSLYNDDGTARAAPVAYSSTVAHDHGSVGSTSVAVGSVAVNNADIWGFASVGGNSTSDLSVGSNGTVAAFGVSQGTVDTTRVATDFTTNFDPNTDPGTGTIITGSFPSSIGTDGTTTVYRYSGTITDSFTVHGNVTLILTGSQASPATNVVRLTGNDNIEIPSNASLNIYAYASMDFGGNSTSNGITNDTSQASNLQIYGLDTTGAQEFDIGGGPSFKGLIYAPNSTVKINGNPQVYGSIVANTITVVGDAAFHYDEALANLGGNNPWGIVKWRELTTDTDRSAYTTAMSGW